MIEKKKRYDFSDLLKIMDTLRGENGCPWDRQQTIDSLRRYLLEETYETLEACDTGGMKLADELGDLLLQIVFMARIGSEDGSFDITDVTTCICKKMITRHPHIFADAKADTAQEVLSNWDTIKRKERGITSHAEAIMDISKSLPALMRAEKIQQKAAKAGFDWDDISGAVAKLLEEVAEMREAIAQKDEKAAAEELGDVLFSVVNVARFLKVSAELALISCNEKFTQRFSIVERLAAAEGKMLEDMTLAQMDVLWEQAKLQLREGAL